MRRDGATMLARQFRSVERARRTDGGHLGKRSFVDRFDMSTGSPTVADNADIEFFHKVLLEVRCKCLEYSSRNGDAITEAATPRPPFPVSKVRL